MVHPRDSKDNLFPWDGYDDGARTFPSEDFGAGEPAEWLFEGEASVEVAFLCYFRGQLLTVAGSNILGDPVDEVLGPQLLAYMLVPKMSSVLRAVSISNVTMVSVSAKILGGVSSVIGPCSKHLATT